MKQLGITVFLFATLLCFSAHANVMIEIKMEAQEVADQEIERVRAEATRAAEKISQVLEIKTPKKLKIKITDAGICRTSKGWILLPITHVRNNTAAVFHETTHILAKHGDNRFFSEGLAIYFQEEYGKDCGFPNFSCEEFHTLLAKYRGKIFPIEKLSNWNQIFRNVGTEDREIAYVEAGSFFIYLADKYGETKIKDLHSSGTVNYKEIYGKALPELEEGWRTFAALGGPSPVRTVIYVEILKTDRIHKGGKPVFKVRPGDQLEVLESRTCRGGSGECWEVRNVSTGKTGFVRADKMRDLHRVYNKSE